MTLAKDLVTDVLAELVDGGYFDVDLEVAQRLLHDNGAHFWRIANEDMRMLTTIVTLENSAPHEGGA